MKSLCLLLPLLITAVLCDKKLNLDDIERDQVRSDSITSSKKLPVETLRTGESKYSAVKAEVGKSYSQKQRQQQYHGPTAASQELGNQVGDYAELQSYESFKYAPTQQNDYGQEKYADTDGASPYLPQNTFLTNPSEQQQQYYIQEGRSNAQNDYETLQHQQHQQQHLYQQEVLVGNQLQTSQQKAAAQKYVEGSDDKGTYYVNIPTSQLLAYYQNYDIAQPKSKNAYQQISIPAYMPLLTQNQVYNPTKVTYQPELQYVPVYPKHTEAVLTKSSKSVSTSTTPTVHASATTRSGGAAHQIPTTRHQEYETPIELLMNHAYAAAYQPQNYLHYVTQQQQYVQQPQQQIVYAENPAATAYTDIYNTPATAYVQENSLYEQQQQQQQQYYVPTAFAEQFMTQILHHSGIQSTDTATSAGVPEPVKQEVQEPIQHNFTPPKYQAQKFRSSHDVTHLVPVSNENEGLSQKSIYSSESSSSSQPKTLLDSYVPSYVIAAQDANRYRERPIKLESGFLPSKINFVQSYKKRKTE